MQLDDFFDYKNKLMEDVITSRSIVSLIAPELDPSDAEVLIYSQVFPYEYIPETIEHGHTYICFDVDIQKSLNKTFLIPTIFVWVFSHKSDIRLKEGGLRTDKIISELSKIMNGSRFYGIGELDLYSVKRFVPVTDYQGKVMTFHTKEWNRPNFGNKDIPSNRKIF